MSLVKAYDKVFEEDSASLPTTEPRPTDESVKRTAKALGLQGLPSLLVQLAREAKYSGVWFPGLGADYGSSCHILQINRYWSDNGLPDNLVAVTYGFDDICDCLDKTSSDDPDCMKIIQVELWNGVCETCKLFACNFEEYLAKMVDLFSRPVGASKQESLKH